MNKKKIAIIILTYNSEEIIKKTITSAKKISKDIIILDSFSKDKTIKIAKKLKCKILKRKFSNYSDQRNFIIKKCNNLYQWQLHIDSDEILSEKLIKNIKNILDVNVQNNSYLIKRHVYFLHKKLLFGGAANWHLRLFPSKSSTCEDKKYDQHFISKLRTKKIKGPLFDFNGNLIGINSSGLDKGIADNVSYSIKSRYLLDLIDVLPESIELPSSKELASKPLTEQIKVLSDYVVLIKVK